MLHRLSTHIMRIEDILTPENSGIIALRLARGTDKYAATDIRRNRKLSFGQFS